MTGAVGYLRVYEPLVAFPEPERANWSRYLAARRAPDRALASRLERAASIAAVVGPSARLPERSLDDEALVLEHEGNVLICPLWTRMRARVELLERAAVSAELLTAGFPRWVVDSAQQEEQAFRRAQPLARAAIRSSAGQIPVSWFVCFAPAEVCAVPDTAQAPGPDTAQAPGPSDGAGAQPPLDTGRALLYRTEMSRARQRVARAMHVLRMHTASLMLAALEDLGRWLEEFHPHSVVELDYDDFAPALGGRAGPGDDSIDLIAESLQALVCGDLAQAQLSFERVTVRWRELAIHQTSN